jgi:hypothetical protein
MREAATVRYIGRSRWAVAVNRGSLAFYRFESGKSPAAAIPLPSTPVPGTSAAGAQTHWECTPAWGNPNSTRTSEGLVPIQASGRLHRSRPRCTASAVAAGTAHLRSTNRKSQVPVCGGWLTTCELVGRITYQRFSRSGTAHFAESLLHEGIASCADQPRIVIEHNFDGHILK